MDITLFQSQGSLFFKKISSKNNLTSFDCDGFLIESEESEIRRILDVLKAKKESKLIAVNAQDDEFNRRIIEKTKVNFLVFSDFAGKDTLKQRDSGLNHVIAKAAAKNNISIVIDFSAIQKLAKFEKAKALAKIIQNIVICRKAKCNIKIASFAENKSQITKEMELKAFLFSLGASSQQVVNACNFN